MGEEQGQCAVWAMTITHSIGVEADIRRKRVDYLVQCHRYAHEQGRNYHCPFASQSRDFHECGSEDRGGDTGQI